MEYIVYVRTDERGVITDINSSAFVDGEGWTEIDRGDGIRYHHAQGNYLPAVLKDEDEVFNFKLGDGHVEERTETEKESDRPAALPTGQSLESRVTELEMAFDALMAGETNE